MTPLLKRRGVLKGLGLGAMAASLPMLRNARVFSQSGEIPKRVIFFYAATGNLASHPHETMRLRGNWEPLAPAGMSAPTETAYELNTMLEPLAAYKQDMILFENLDMAQEWIQPPTQPGPANAHFAGSTIALTANHRFSGEQPGAVSIDQFIAQRINSPSPLTRLPSLEVFGSQYPANEVETPSSIGPGMQVPVLWEPGEVYDRVFPDPPNPANQDEAVRLADQRDRVFEFVLSRHANLRDRVGAADRVKIQQHLDTVSDLRRRLNLGTRDVVIPARRIVDPWEATFNNGLEGDERDVMRWHLNNDINMQIAVAGLHADVTRVALLQVVDPPGAAFGYVPGQFGSEGPHDLQHKVNDEDNIQYTDVEARATLARSHLLVMEKFRNLLDQLASRTESDGSRLLDHTAVVFCSEIGNGSHDLSRLPWIVAGSAGGYFRTGRYIQLPRTRPSYYSGSGDVGRPHNDLFVSIANAMGVDVDTFGNPDICTGPITQMR